MKNATAKPRILWADLLRISAAVAAILIHTAGHYWHNLPLDSSEWQIVNFYHSVTRWIVPVFIMISGMFFLNPLKEIGIKKLFSKYIRRIVTVYLGWSLFYALFTVLVVNDGHTQTIELITSVVRETFAGHIHMWFLQILLILYLLMPILRKIVTNKFIFKYFLVLFFVFVFCYDFAVKVYFLTNINVSLDGFNLYLVFGYIFYFLLGYYLANHNFTAAAKYIIYFLGVTGTVYTITATSYYSLKFLTYQTLFNDSLTPNVLFSAAALFIFFKDIVSKINFTSKTKEIIKISSFLSLGIYLIHPFIIYCFVRFKIFSAFGSNYIAAVPLIAAGVLVFSWYCIYLIYKINFIKRNFL